MRSTALHVVLANQVPKEVEPSTPDEPESSVAGNSPTESPETTVEESQARQRSVKDENGGDHSRVSVFSADATSRFSERVVDQVVCLCGETIPVRVEDFGLTVYCPRCGSEVQVGAQIADHLKRQKLMTEPGKPAQVVVPPVRIYWLRSPMSLVVTVLAIASVGAAVFITWDHRNEAFRWVGLVTPDAPSVEPGEPSNSKPFAPEDVTVNAIESLVDLEDPFEILMYAVTWERGLRDHDVTSDDLRFAELMKIQQHVLRDQQQEMCRAIDALATRDDPVQALKTAQQWLSLLCAVQLSNDDERIMTLAETAKLLLEKADPISLEQIAALLETSDYAAALVQAQMWDEELRDRGTPPDDPRLAKLQTVIGELFQRIAPPPPGMSPVVLEFRTAVDQLSQHLHASLFTQARETVNDIEKLLLEHAELLAAFTRRYLSLKARLEQAELRTEGVTIVRKLLDEAEVLLTTQDVTKVTEAWQALAQAKYIAWRTPMTPANAEQLLQLANEIEPQLLLMRGKRAVHDAVACDREGESTMRDHLAFTARSLLEGFPTSSIRPLLEQVEPWTKATPRSAGQPAPSSSPKTDLGQSLKQRALFENALDPYGDLDTDGLIQACKLYLDSQHSSRQTDDPHLAPLQKMCFALLQHDITEMLQQLQSARDEHIDQHIRALKEHLEEAAFWKQTPSWIALDGSIRQASRDLARKALSRAKGLARQSKYEEATEAAAFAAFVGDHDIIKEATQLQDEVREEIALRKSTSGG